MRRIWAFLSCAMHHCKLRAGYDYQKPILFLAMYLRVCQCATMKVSQLGKSRTTRGVSNANDAPSFDSIDGDGRGLLSLLPVTDEYFRYLVSLRVSETNSLKPVDACARCIYRALVNVSVIAFEAKQERRCLHDPKLNEPPLPLSLHWCTLARRWP